MLSAIFIRPSVIARLQHNPLGPYLEQLATRLHEQGYGARQIRVYLRAGDKFGRWLSHQGYPLTPITEALLQRYVTDLPRYRRGRQGKAALGLTHLFQLLRQAGLVAPSPQPITPADQWRMRYDHYLKTVLGAADKTRASYGPVVCRFAHACCGSSEPYWAQLTAPQITAFVQREAATRHRSGRKLPSTAVRSFLRFLVFQGEIKPGLEAAAPLPSRWAQAALPVRLMPEDVARVVAVYRDPPTYLRNYAIVLLLARLGLRGSEVLALQLARLSLFAPIFPSGDRFSAYP